MKTRKTMLLIMLMTMMVAFSATTVEAKKTHPVDVEQVSQLTWPELRRSLLGIPDNVEGFRCCQLANGFISQLKEFERNPELKVDSKTYPGGNPEEEGLICESIEEAFENATGIEMYFYTKVGEDRRIELRVMKLEALSKGEELWV